MHNVRKKSFHLFLLIALCTFALGIRSTVLAQESEDVLVIPQQIDPNKLPALQQTYLGQLEQYRVQELKFEVSKEQYLQLQTLASQEEAIKEMRALLVLRSEILLTYIDILDERLNQALGIPLENKNAEKITLTLLKEKVMVHKTRVEAAFDRLALDQETTTFEPTVTEIEEHSYYILNMIRAGRVQYAIDKLILLRQAIQTEIDNQQLNATKKAEKVRGFQEIDRLIEELNTEFETVETSVHRTPGKANATSYSEISKNLGGPYTKIHQALAFLKEIRKP